MRAWRWPGIEKAR